MFKNTNDSIYLTFIYIATHRSIEYRNKKETLEKKLAVYEKEKIADLIKLRDSTESEFKELRYRELLLQLGYIYIVYIHNICIYIYCINICL